MANSATVGILRALLVADTAEFEQSLGDATKQVQKLENALNDVGGKTVGAMDPAGKSFDLAADKAEQFWKKLDGTSGATKVLATETGAATTELTGFAGIAQAFVEGAGGTLSVETAATATAFGELALPIAAAAVALGAWLAWVYKYTDVGPMLLGLWRSLKDAIADVAAIVGGELVRQWKAFAALTTIFQDAIPGVLNLKLAVAGLNILLADTVVKARVAQGIFELIKAMQLGGLSGGIPMPTPASPFRSGGVPGGPGPLVDPKAVEEELNRQIKAAQDAAEAQERYNKAVQAGADILTGKALAKQVKLVADELARAGGVGKITAFEYQELGKKLTTLVAQGAQLPPELNAIYVSTLSLTKLVPTMGTGLDRAALGFEDVTRSVKQAWKDQVTFNAELDKFNSLAKESPSLITKLVKGWESVKLQPPPIGEWTAWRNTLETMFAEVATRSVSGIMTAIQTGNWADVGRSVGQTLSSAIAPVLSGMLKDSLGRAAPVAGEAMATGVGMWFTGFFNAWEQNRIAEAHQIQWADQVTDLKRTLVGPGSLFETFDQLEASANQLGLSFKEAWNSAFPVPERLKQEIAEFEARLRGLLQKLATDFDKLNTAASAYGRTLPASLRATIAPLLENKNLTAEMRANLERLAKDPSWQELEQTATDLGIDLAALGPKFQQAKIGDIALDLVRKLTLLTDAGGNVDGILKGVTDELTTLYRNAVSTGAHLPETLRPWMEKLVAAGLLVDENGDKITDLNAITFDPDVKDQPLIDIKDILEDIRDLLANKLPAAAEQAADGINAAFGRIRPPDIPPIGIAVPRPPGTPPTAPTQPGEPDTPDFPPVAVPRVQPMSIPDLGPDWDGQLVDGGATNITVISTLDGKEVARNQVRYLPRALQLAGL